MQIAFINTHRVVVMADMDVEVEVIASMEGVVVAHLASPSIVAEGVDYDFMFMVETEVDVKNNMRAREELNGEIFVMSMFDVSVEVNLGSIVKWLMESDNSGNTL